MLLLYNILAYPWALYKMDLGEIAPWLFVDLGIVSWAEGKSGHSLSEGQYGI